MNKKLLLSSASVLMSLGLLSACGVDNNGVDTDGPNITPVRYDRQNNNGVFDNDLRNNNVDPVRYDTDENMFNNNRDNNGLNDNRNNDDGLFDVNNNNDDDLFDVNNDNDLFDNNNNNNRGLFDGNGNNDLFDNDVDNDLLNDDNNGRDTRQVDPGTQGNVNGRS